MVKVSSQFVVGWCRVSSGSPMSCCGRVRRLERTQRVCFIAHVDRWLRAEGIGLDGLSGPVIERYLAERRAAGYRENRSVKALRPLLGARPATGH